MPADANDDEPTSLDLDHVAELANLPLADEEREDLEEACREVLATFRLEETEEEPDRSPGVHTFADEADPWPEEEIEAILEAFPDRDGRELLP